MVIQSQDIKVLLTGGANNTDPMRSLGGHVSVTELTSDSFNNLFDDISVAEAEQGDISYRGIAFRNDNDETSYGIGQLWIENDTLQIYHFARDIPWRPNSTDAFMQTIDHEHAEPIGVTWKQANKTSSFPALGIAGCANGQIPGVGQTCGSLGSTTGDFAPNSYNYYWIRRTIPPGTAPLDRYRAVLRLQGSPGAGV